MSSARAIYKTAEPRAAMLQSLFPASASTARNKSNANTSHFEFVTIETNAGLVFRVLVLPEWGYPV